MSSGLALMIMDAELKVDLRVLVPAVENSISANAFRPGDILPQPQAGLTVEINNTDAEGRLVLADALALADAEEPDLLIDMATLTGAARVALGPDLPPYYSDDDDACRAKSTNAQPRRRRSRSGGCRSTWAMTRTIFRARSRTSTNAPVRRHRRLDHRGAVPQAVRRQDEELGPFRHLRLGPDRSGSCARRRRGPRRSARSTIF
jgi:hypothetical protein